MRGRGRNRRHLLCAQYGQSTVSGVHPDYCFFTEKDDERAGPTSGPDDDEACDEAEVNAKFTTLVMKETECGSLWAYPVRHKGTVKEPWVAKQVIWDLDTVGISGERLAVKSDQEAAITDLSREIARLRGGRGIALDESRAGDSNSNARIEQAV